MKLLFDFEINISFCIAKMAFFYLVFYLGWKTKNGKKKKVFLINKAQLLSDVAGSLILKNRLRGKNSKTIDN